MENTGHIRPGPGKLEGRRKLKAIEVIKKVAESEVKKLHTLELGIVTSAFPHSSVGDKDNYECNVKLKNRDLELRRVPIATQMIGLAHVPNVGDLVILSFINGNINAPIVIGRLYNDENRPPISGTGEVVLELPNGISLTVTADGLKAAAGKSVITIKSDGDITIESYANIGISAGGDMSLSAKNLNLKGDMININ